MSDSSSLSVTYDPGEWAILGLLTCLVVCLAFAVAFALAVATDRGKPVLGEEPSEDIVLLAGFSLGALFFAGWAVLEILRRRKKIRAVRRFYLTT